MPQISLQFDPSSAPKDLADRQGGVLNFLGLDPNKWRETKPDRKTTLRKLAELHSREAERCVAEASQC